MDLCPQSNVSAFKYAVYVCHSFLSKEQASFNFTGVVTIRAHTQRTKVQMCTCEVHHTKRMHIYIHTQITHMHQNTHTKYTHIYTQSSCSKTHTMKSTQVEFWRPFIKVLLTKSRLGTMVEGVFAPAMMATIEWMLANLPSTARKHSLIIILLF